MKNRENLKNKILASAFVVVIVIGLFLIFKDEIKDYYINHFIIPFFSKFQDHNVWCGIWILTISIFICLYVASRQWRSCAYPKVRYLYEFVFFVFTFLLYFVFSKDIVLNSVFEFRNNSCVLQYLTSYINEFWICVFVAETILGLKIHKNRNINTNDIDLKESVYLYDQPTDKDDFNRCGYAEVVVKKIIATFNEEKNIVEKNNDETDSINGAFVINISENYGYGKSSFLLLLKKEARAYSDKNKMVLFEYKPWLCDNPQKIISELFNLLNENLSKYIPNIGKSINKYVHLLLEYYSSKNALAYVLSNCFKEQPSIFKERERLKNDIQKLNKPIVIVIDDVDRLRDEELLTLFSLLRNTADFPNVFYILAADMTYVKQVLKRKGVEDQEGYIKKFINYEFLIPGFNIDIMGKVLDETLRSTLERVKDDFKKDDGDFVDNIIKDIRTKVFNEIGLNDVFTNIRDFKRFCNNYATAIDCYIHCNYKRITHLADDFDLSDLFAIELLKYLSEDTYKILRDRDNLILNSSEGIQLKGSMIYTLKEEYQEIISKIVTTRVDQFFADKNKKADKNKDEQENQEHENDSIKSILDKNKNISKDNTICLILKYLFPKDTSKLGVNSICYNDAYFQYFTYRFKNNQMSVNEVIYIIKNLSIDNYKTELKKIVKDDKSDSFVHKLQSLKNEGSLDVSFIDKLFIFVEECNRYTNEHEIGRNNIPCTEDGIYEIQYKISQILFKWYSKINYQEIKGSQTFLNTLKKNMNKLILENSHINLLCLFFKDMIYYNDKDRSIFDKFDMSYWLGLLLNRCFNDKNCDISDAYKKDFGDQLQYNIRGIRWMSFFIIREGKHYTVNISFITKLFNDLNNAIEYINSIHGDNITWMSDILDLNSKAYLNSNAAELKEELLSSFNEDDISKERIENHLILQYKNTDNIYILKNKANFKSDATELKEDLISLLKNKDISNEKIEDHPFLQYAEMVNKMYLWDDDLQKLASSVQ